MRRLRAVPSGVGPGVAVWVGVAVGEGVTVGVSVGRGVAVGVSVGRAVGVVFAVGEAVAVGGMGEAVDAAIGWAGAPQALHSTATNVAVRATINTVRTLYSSVKTGYRCFDAAAWRWRYCRT